MLQVSLFTVKENKKKMLTISQSLENHMDK